MKNNSKRKIIKAPSKTEWKLRYKEHKNMIKISMEKNEKLDEAFEKMVKSTKLVAETYQINYYEMFGLIECLKMELEKSMYEGEQTP